MRKQYFNLIEIALAIAIIAVGMSSVLVLFPAGLNAVNSAAADNSAPDAVQYLAGYVESCIRHEWNSSATRTSNTVNNLLTEKPGAGDEGAADSPEKAESGWDQIEDPNDNTKKLPIFTSGTRGLFKYEQTHMVNSQPVVDFAAAARVWRQDNFIAVPGQSAPVPMTGGSVTIFIEVSYPLEKPYEERDKQMYRLDLYDYGA